MRIRPHRYAATVRWSGRRESAVSYEGYSRDYVVEIAGKAPLAGSADVHFRGDPALHNPEDLLVAALSACHMLSYLALCARRGIAVTSYEDDAQGEMAAAGGKIRFREVVLHPRVTIAGGERRDEADALHAQAHEECFIASSVNFPVRHQARTVAAAQGDRDAEARR